MKQNVFFRSTEQPLFYTTSQHHPERPFPGLVSLFSTFLSLWSWTAAFRMILARELHNLANHPSKHHFSPNFKPPSKGRTPKEGAPIHAHISLSQTLGNIARPFRVVVFLSIYGNLYVLDNLRKLFTPFTVFSHSHYLLSISLEGLRRHIKYVSCQRQCQVAFSFLCCSLFLLSLR